ncbi:recombinase zinc beta ribbon domain-containing protein [Kitasatospora sp. NPDC048545]|uniref:recombinase zinc beta ribbon domain-containing protein n=1 Tax=Kitasatospora sp. NPDC048545 TaxID=3157208 RepID=UPI003403980E
MPPRLFGFADFSRERLHTEEAAITAEAAQRSADGDSDAAVATFLGKAGFVGTLGAPFTSQTAGRLLTNPAIAGLKLDANGDLVPAGHPGMISPELFATVLEQHSPKPRVEDYDYMLTAADLTVCGRCGIPLVGQRSSAGKPGYCCPDGQRQDRPGKCGSVRIDATLLEDHLGEQILARLMLPATQADLEKARKLLAAQLETDRSRLAEIEASMLELTAMVVRRELQAKDLKKAKAEAAEESKLIKRRVRWMAKAVATPITGDVEELVTWWNTSSAETRRGLALLMLHRIDVNTAGKGVRSIAPGRVVLWWRNEAPPAPIVLADA